MSQSHTYINRRADSTFGNLDTGVKLTTVFAIGCQNQPPIFKLFSQGLDGKSKDEPVQEIKLT